MSIQSKVKKPSETYLRWLFTYLELTLHSRLFQYFLVRYFEESVESYFDYVG